VSILIGKEEQQFTVHKDSICAKSKFFKAACSERWIEGKHKVVKLPDLTARDFQTYVHWVYTSRIEVKSEEVEQKEDDHLKTYILGDVLDDYQLRNAVMDQLINSIPLPKTQASPSFHKHVYECTPAGSPLRKFLVDCKIHDGCRKDFAGNSEKYPVEFLQELAVALLRKVPTTKDETLITSLRRSYKWETGDA
jgi:hypothetical protein